MTSDARRRHAPRAVVVGAGLGGLAAAIRLAAAGVAVTLCEREAVPGGRAGLLERDGFRFDTGPTVLTLPSLLADLFALRGEDLGDHLDLVQLDPAYRAVFHDGSVLHVRAGVDAMAEEVRAVCGAAEAGAFRRFAVHLERLYHAEYATFIDANFDSPLDLAKPVAMARLLRLGGFSTVQRLVAGHLADWRLQRLFTFQSMYAGMSPYEALGVYAVIAYMDAIAGVYFPRGGIHAVSRALADLALRAGVDLLLGTAVDAVEVSGGRAAAVRTAGGERLPCDVVVLNPDLPVAYRTLLPEAATPGRVRRLRYSPSCVVVHLGLARPPAGAAHHTIHFAEDYRAGFEDLLGGSLQRDPSWFLSVPTTTDPGLAPAGGAVAYQLLPVPNLEPGRAARAPWRARSGPWQRERPELDWDAQAPREREAAIARLTGAGYGITAADVVTSAVVTPLDWQRQGLAAGTPFAASHHFGQTGPFRPRNLAPKVAGVVFAGSGTTPGVGVPMVLVSGRLAAARALQMLGRGVVGGRSASGEMAGVQP